MWFEPCKWCTEDGFIHCLKKGQPCEAVRQKPNSQLSILVDKSDAVNPFISPSDEEDANEKMNAIEDETDEEIIFSLGKPIDSYWFKMSCLSCLVFICVHCFFLKMMKLCKDICSAWISRTCAGFFWS